MIPLNDTEPNRYAAISYMTLIIIAINVLVAIIQWITGWGNDQIFLYRFGSTPRLILAQQGGLVLSSITSAFLHGGLLHLLSNMSALWVFGKRVEDACGPWRFLCFYLTAGICADIMSTVVRYNSPIPSIGASGAVFGLMGAYLVLFPNGRIRTALFLAGIPTFPKVKAIWIIIYYMFFQILSAITTLFGDSGDQVNYWAHLGGFFSCLLIFLFLRPEAFKRYINDQPI